ncbi:hypothetical protein EC973_002442 [Apophysomyces ossiformis]|uniref:RRM domain-containing protein n=1 Tax=Apophysomyces ossiformis TaxID=679940 RepID=A0A8H7BIB3_9FUNG|nr:hypothetical protein EC973_002442 [Apophysomyces ossiformis]
MLTKDTPSEKECKTLSVSKLDPRINEKLLQDVFFLFAPVVQVQIIRKSLRGYQGYVEFYERQGAEQALHAMDGRTMFGQQIQVSWATESNWKTVDPESQRKQRPGNISYEEIFVQAPPHITTIYVENLQDKIIRQDIGPYFQQYGYVSDVHMAAGRGCAFVKMDTHANAATAILALQGYSIKGRPVKLSWADENEDFGQNGSKACPPFGASGISVHSELGSYDMLQTRPPAPVIGESDSLSIGVAGNGGYGWNQYYQTYYNGGCHQCV